MKIEVICALIMCAISSGGVLVYVGRSIGILNSLAEGVRVALAKTDKHDNEIAAIRLDLNTVKTKQEDCGTCP
jgi:hypothetical protein